MAFRYNTPPAAPGQSQYAADVALTNKLADESDELDRRIAYNNELEAFIIAIGVAHGMKGMPVDFDAFAKLVTARYKNENPDILEATYIEGHQKGNARLEYAMAHGASRPPHLTGGIINKGIIV